MSGEVLRLVCRNDSRHFRWVDADTMVGGRPVADWWANVAGQQCKACREAAAAVPDPERVPSPAEARRMAATNGPATSRLAARLAAPKAGTRKANVLAVLRAAEGAWVAGEQIAVPEVGGSEGLKRLRELRADGFLIEEKPPPGGDGMWWYRLADDGDGAPAGLFDPA